MKWNTTITSNGILLAVCKEPEMCVEGTESLDELYATIEEVVRLYSAEMVEDGLEPPSSWSLTVQNPIPQAAAA